ncbi:MAG: ribosomal RNA small subunit methyltransferase A [Deltaproteobacteria bacterium]|nr:ribosomal RNA small subunit methyltransferase A [Deltaproteobacteria bacterium]
MSAGIPAFEDPRKVLARYGLAPKRRMSQNFLIARSVVERIADAANAAPGAPVVELGPGLGTLTGELLRRGSRVVAVEKDPQMIAVLEAEFGDVDAFEVRAGDATSLDLGALAIELGGPLTLVGNLPYAATGAIMRNLVRQRSAIAAAVVMVQREVRDRLAADPGTSAYGALTVFVRAAFEVERVINVTPGSFHPPPKVASAVARLVPPAELRAEETETFRGVVRSAFDARRKTLRNALRRKFEGDQVDAALEATGIDGRRRGETLSVEEFRGLAEAIERAVARAIDAD